MISAAVPYRYCASGTKVLELSEFGKDALGDPGSAYQRGVVPVSEEEDA